MNTFQSIVNLIANNGRRQSGTISVYKIYKHGELTWLIDSTATYASFLHLYSASTKKAKAFKLIIKLIWALRIQSLFFKKEKVPYSIGSLLDSLFINSVSELSLFTGTVGENRKMVLYFKYFGNGQFVKFPFGDSSQALVEKEHKSLTYLNSLNLRTIIAPALTYKETFTMIADVCNSKSVPYDALDSRAYSFCDELVSKTLIRKSFSNLDVDFSIAVNIQYILNNLAFISDIYLKKNMTDLIDRANNLVKNLDTDFRVSCSYCHGDFTPWNSFSTNSKLALIDWELSGQYPVFFDLIHFTVSKNALIGDLNLPAIYNELLEVKNTLSGREVLLIELKHFHIYVRLYSLISIAFYGKKFLIQDNQLHEQAHTLLKVWGSLLSYE